ncbi:MAG: AlpA family phage regulatory protein [Candidatus Thiothrix sulfatifontis]|nr:MAG: AlpA family phage regulatory protein [Candidatus Thiothrix sulfatifontis]
MLKPINQDPHPISGVPQPHDRAARLPEVIQITQRSKTMIYEDIRAGRFPAGFLIGKKARAWMLSDVMGWLASRKQGGAM